jgi:plastocyanin
VGGTVTTNFTLEEFNSEGFVTIDSNTSVTVTAVAGPAPILTQATSDIFAQSATAFDLGTVTPGQSGDSLSVTGNGVSLVQIAGQDAYNVIYTPTTPLAPGATATVNYTIDDTTDGGTVTGAGSITIDPGPTITASPITPATMLSGSSEVIGTVTVGETGDTVPTITQTNGSGTVSLMAGPSAGTYEVLYTAPGVIQTSTVDPVSFTVTDQRGDISAPATIGVQLDEHVTSEITGTMSNQQAFDNATVTPFANVTITDLNATPALELFLGYPSTPQVLDAVVITLSGGDADGTLSGTGLVKSSLATGLYTLSATDQKTLNTELQGLVFRPTAGQVAPGGTVTTDFTLTEFNSDGFMTTDSNTSVNVTAASVASTIDVPNPVQAVSDESSVAAFRDVTINDPDPNPTETVTLTLTGANGVTPTDANGTLSGAGLQQTGAGTYTLTGLASSVMANLEGLIFTPTAHQVAPGSTVTTNISIIDENSAGLTTPAGTLSVVTTAANDAPTITAGVVGQTTQGGSSTPLFANVTIGDVDAGAQDSLAITVASSGTATDANGTLSLATGGLTETSVGQYTLSTTSLSNLNTELQQIAFTPTQAGGTSGQAVTTTFTIAATQNGLTTDNNTLSYTQGPAGGNATIDGSASGSDLITAYGSNNAIFSMGTSDVIIAGQSNAVVDGSTGNDQITLSGVQNVVWAADGKDSVSGTFGNSNIALGNGNDTVSVIGQGNTIALGNGNDTINLNGSSNSVTSGGVANFISVGNGSDTFMLAGQGLNEIAGFAINNGDQLDLTQALTASGWTGTQATLGNYLQVSDAANTATLSIVPNGSGAGVAIAQLDGVSGLTLATLQPHLIA